MEDTDNDSVLMLRQMYLTLLAYKGLGQLTVPHMGSSFLEHPINPMECSKTLAQRGAHRSGSHGPTFNGRTHIKFDECRLGQVVKSTTLSTDLPLHHWHDLRCNHGAHPRGEKLNSSDLSRCPEQMMQGLAAAILCRAGAPGEPNDPPEATEGTFSQHAGGQQAPVPEAGQQALAGSLPVSASDNPEVRTPTQLAGETDELWGGTLSPEPWARHCMEISDRPTILPITHDPNLSDNHVPPDGLQTAPPKGRGGKALIGTAGPVDSATVQSRKKGG